MADGTPPAETPITGTGLDARVKVFVSIVQQVGFPILVAGWFIWRLQPILEDMVKSQNYATWTLAEVQKHQEKKEQMLEKAREERQHEHQVMADLLQKAISHCPGLGQ